MGFNLALSTTIPPDNIVKKEKSSVDKPLLFFYALKTSPPIAENRTMPFQLI